MKIKMGKLRELITEEIVSFKAAPPRKHSEEILGEMKTKLGTVVELLKEHEGSLYFSEVEEIVQKIDEIRVIMEAKNG